MNDIQETQPIEVKPSISNGFIYENEHPHLSIPFSARIGERRLEGKSISITDALVSGLLPPKGIAQGSPITLRFDFEEFTINLFLSVNVVKMGNEDSSDYCLQFCDPSGTHLPPLRYIMNSHLAGDLVTVGRFLGYTGPTQEKPKAEQIKPRLMRRVVRRFRQFGIVALSVGLIVTAGTVLRDRLIFSYEPRPVLVSQTGDTLRATSAGQITYINDTATAGNVIYSIGANSGNLLSVRMPCDCTIVPFADFYEGATVLSGTPLLQLVQDDAKLEVSTEISFAGARRLISGDRAELEFSDGRVVPVGVELTPASSNGEASDGVAAQIEFLDHNTQYIFVGETANLRFRRNLVPDEFSAWVEKNLENLPLEQVSEFVSNTFSSAASLSSK